MSGSLRKEYDSLGEVFVPSHALWGAQTQRALSNFEVGNEQVPIEIIQSLAAIKQASAIVNEKLGVLEKDKSLLIVHAAKEISQGLHSHEFPLSIWQSGSGTQTNMNVNEVISNLISKNLGKPMGSYDPIHPNDHVNRSQSTNDTFPAAIHIATIKKAREELLPEIKELIILLKNKSNEWKDVIKIGRTHLQDAVPITLGQEVSSWVFQIEEAYRRIEESLLELHALPLGGTAVGTGLTTPQNFDNEIISQLNQICDLKLSSCKNKFAIMSSHDGLVNTMSKLKLLAICLLKIVNDIRLLSCGPRAGISELQLPENEPGSSIMPGKVNPTQCESMSMICTQVIGMEVSVSMAGSGGHLQMNAYKPLIGFNIIKSIDLLTSSCKSCRKKMFEGIEPNFKKIESYLNQSLMLVTVLTPEIGYKKACEIAQYAYKESTNLRDAATKLGHISADRFDEIVQPIKMVNNKTQSN